MTTYNLNFYLYYAGGYNLIDRDHVAAAGVTYSRGVSDDWDLSKSSVSVRLLDDADRYRGSNPESPLYGIIGQYLPFAYYNGSNPRASGELEMLTADQTDSHRATTGVTVRGSRWVDVKASGPLASVGRWREIVSSPMYLFIRNLPTLVDYFPGEDAEGSTLVSSATGGRPGAASDVDFAGAAGPAGSNPLIKLGTAGLLTGYFKASSYSTSAWQISWTSDMAGADVTERIAFSWSTSNGYRWDWYASLTTYRIKVTDLFGDVLLDAGVANGGVGPGQQVVFRMKATRSSTTWTLDQAWWEEGETTLIGTSSNFSHAAATTAKPHSWRVQASTIMNGGYFGQLFAVTTAADDLQSYDMLQAINGYPEETTAERFERICGLRNIPTTVLGDTATPQGAQRPGVIKAQLQEIQRTEQGLIFESAPGRGLTLALRSYLYEQANTPALTLTCPTDCAPPKEAPTTAELYNTIVLQDRSGLNVTAVATAGRYGTAEPPDGCGVVDKAISVNLFDPDQVENLAGSYLAYHQQETRFGQITVDLDRDPSLTTAVEALDVGMCIKLIGRTPDPVTLLVTNISGNDRRVRRQVTFDVAPADVFVTGVYTTGTRRYDLATCTVNGTPSTTATSWTFDITDDESWSTTAEPYDLTVAGEVITVTTMNTRTGSAGAYQQTATVTRSVNGVVKSHTAGTAVHIATPGHYGV